MKKSVVIAVVVLTVALVWVISGQFGGDVSSAGPEEIAAAEELTAVRVREIEANDKTSVALLQGKTEAARDIQLRAETAGPVVEIGAREGDVVSKGDLILRLDAEDRRAKLAEAEAFMKQRKIESDATERLAQKEFASKTKLAESRAKLDEASARVAAARLALDRVALRAPFDGTLSERMVEVGDFVAAGAAVARILDVTTIIVTGDLTENQAPLVNIGSPAQVRLVDGSLHEGKVRFVSPAARESTRTYRVEIEVANPEQNILVGQTAELRLPLKRVKAHLVAPSILTLNDSGQIGVKTVNADGIVEFHSVDIIADGPDGVWLTGLGEKARVIVVGQDYVRVGEKVNPVLADEAATAQEPQS